MWGIFLIISLISAIAFLIMMVMAESGTNMKKVGIGMFVTSLCFSLISGAMWFKNRNVEAQSSEEESTD
jgi:hypothetical protein